MASTLLPQALFSNPRTTHFPSHITSLKPTSITHSRISLTRVRSKIVPIVIQNKRRSVLVRAEGENENPEVEVEVEAESVSVAVVEPEVKPPRKPIVKLGDIMGILNKRAIEASDKERPTPDLRTGDIVQIKLEVPENRRRQSIYKGIVISKQNAGIHTTIRIRNIIAGIGVEIVFPVYSPNIKEIKVVKHRKVRRARLYFLRDKLPRLSTFK